MKLSIIFLLVVFATKFTDSALIWRSLLKDRESEAIKIADWITASQNSDSSGIIPNEPIYPVEESYLLPNDENSRLVVCGYPTNEGVNLFFLALIQKKVVEVGPIRKAIAKQRLPSYTDQPPEVELAKSDAAKFKQTLFETWRWETKTGKPSLDLVKAYNLQFELEFYHKCKNGKTLGIYQTPNNGTTFSFCFAVPKLLDEEKVVFEYMGAHYNSRIKAFRDLRKYTLERKMLLVDKWQDLSDFPKEDGIHDRIGQLKSLAKLRLGDQNQLSTYQEMEVVLKVGSGSQDATKLLVIFVVPVEKLYLAVAGVPQSSSDPRMTLTFLECHTNEIDAENAIENNFNIAFTNRFKSHHWFWAWEINYVKSLRELFTAQNLKNIEDAIKKSACFKIPKGNSVDLKKIRQRGQGHWDAIYEFLEKFCIVALLENSDGVPHYSIVTFVGSLGTDDDVDAGYNDFCLYFPFSREARFSKGVGIVQPLEEEYRNLFSDLYKSALPTEWLTTLESEEISLAESAIAYSPVPFYRLTGSWPYCYFVPYKIKPKVQSAEPLMFYIIAEVDSDHSEVIPRLIESFEEPIIFQEAQKNLQEEILYDHFKSLITPRNA